MVSTMTSINIRLTPEEVQRYFRPPTNSKEPALGSAEFLVSRGFPANAKIELLEYTTNYGNSMMREGPLLRIMYDNSPKTSQAGET